MQALAAQMSPAQLQILNTLGTFTYKLRPTIGQYALDGFDLLGDPRQGLRDILRIELRPRPGAWKPIQAFMVVNICIRPVISFGRQTREMQELAESHFNEGIRSGGIGGVVVSMVDVESRICHAFSIGFNKTAAERPRNANWKRLLAESINEGKLL